MTAENVTPIRQDSPPVKTVTLPPTRAALAWDRATDQLVAAAEADEAKAKDQYEAAKLAYQETRQHAHLMRQLRQLARVDGSTQVVQMAAASKRWARDFDACVNCGTTTIKHAGKGRCMTCQSHWQRTGQERPVSKETPDGN